MNMKSDPSVRAILWHRFTSWLIPNDVLGDIRYEAWDKEGNPLERERRIPYVAENVSRVRLSLSKASMGR